MCYNYFGSSKGYPALRVGEGKRGEPTPFLRELDFKVRLRDDFERHPLKEEGSTYSLPDGKRGVFN